VNTTLTELEQRLIKLLWCMVKARGGKFVFSAAILDRMEPGADKLDIHIDPRTKKVTLRCTR
jgi:hypothetical protein